MITNDQITALAREYAEECCPIEAYETAELIDPYKEEVFERKADILATQIEFEQFLEWLLRRFCLVEKEVVRNEYQETRGRETYATEHKNELYAKLLEMKRLVLESLFPDIAKEVEG